MGLPSTYTQAYGQLGKFFSKIRDAQAPDEFTNQIFKDLGFQIKQPQAIIPLMKSLGFLAADGALQLNAIMILETIPYQKVKWLRL